MLQHFLITQITMMINGLSVEFTDEPMFLYIVLYSVFQITFLTLIKGGILCLIFSPNSIQSTY